MKPARSAEVSLEGLAELAADRDQVIAAAAETALRCVRDAGADPRLMLLVVEAAVEGKFEFTERGGYERAHGGDGRFLSLLAAEGEA